MTSPDPVPIVLVGWAPEEPQEVLEPWRYNDGVLFVAEDIRGVPVVLSHLVWVRPGAPEAPGLLDAMRCPPGELLDELLGQPGDHGYLAAVATRVDPSRFDAVRSIVSTIIVGYRSEVKRTRASKPGLISGADGSTDPGEPLWQPGIPAFVRHHDGVLAAPGTVHDYSNGGLPGFGDRDTSARDLPGATFPKGTLTPGLIRKLEAVLRSEIPVPLQVGAGSLGRLIRLVRDAAIPGPSVATELLELASRPAVAHVLMGAQFWGYNHRIWIRGRPQWLRSKGTRWGRDPETKQRFRRDDTDFEWALTAPRVRAHLAGSAAIGIHGNAATTWTCIDLDYSHHIPRSEENRVAVVARYRDAVHRILAAFPEAVVEARITRDSPEDSGFYPVRAGATLATRTLFRTAAGTPVHLCVDDALTWVHGIHVWIQWPGWYPRDGLVEAMTAVLNGLGLGHVVHGVGADIEVYPRGSCVMSLPLRCSPVQVLGTPGTGTVPHLDYVLVDADLVPVLCPLRPQAKGATGELRPQDFLLTKMYLAQEWAHLDTSWRPSRPPPGAPEPARITDVTVGSGPPANVGGRVMYAPGAFVVPGGPRVAAVPVPTDQQVVRPVVISTEITLRPGAWGRWARGIAAGLPEVRMAPTVDPVVLGDLMPGDLAMLSRRTGITAIHVLEGAAAAFRSGIHGLPGPQRPEPAVVVATAPVLSAAFEEALAHRGTGTEEPGADQVHSEPGPQATGTAAVQPKGPAGAPGPEDSDEDATGTDGIQFMEYELSMRSCGFPLDAAAQLEPELRTRLRQIQGPREAQRLDEIRDASSNDQILFLVQVLNRNGASYRDAALLLEEILEDSPGYSGNRDDLDAKLKQTWGHSSVRVLKQGRLGAPRKRRGPGLTPEQVAWISAVVEEARASPLRKVRMRKASTVATWKSVLGAVIWKALQEDPETWKRHPMSERFLRPKKRKPVNPRSEPALRFSNLEAVTLFKAWLLEKGYAVPGTSLGPRMPMRYDITELMAAVPRGPQ